MHAQLRLPPSLPDGGGVGGQGRGAGGVRQAYHVAVGALQFADVNAWVGPHPDPLVPYVGSLRELAEAAGRAGIAEVVASHTDALWVDPWEGNARLLEELGALAPQPEMPRTWAGLCLLPDKPPGGLEAYLDEGIVRGARLARLFPRSHGFVLAEWCCGPVLAALEARRLALMIRHTETSWGELHSLCELHPGLVVIVDGADQKLLYHNRALEALLAAHPNLLVETHNLVHFLGLDALVRRFGAGRFLYGSGMPQRSPAAAMALVALGSFPEAGRQAVAGGNWRRLAGGA